MKKIRKIIGIGILCFTTLLLQAAEKFITFSPVENAMAIISNGKPSASLLVDNEDHKGVLRAVNNLQKDIEMVSGNSPNILHKVGKEKTLIIIGSIDNNLIIKELAKQNKINGALLKNKREAYLIQVVENPFDDVEKALVIAGSDKRGTIFGIYELSAQIGVSPWHYWADVPVQKRQNVYAQTGTYTDGEPKVKYRGIFLNDEEPSLGSWTRHTFGGFNSSFYEKVFELILRLKGNFIWPAMWGKAFYADDPQNGILADEMGIIIGTSHHEPMGRAHTEWNRNGHKTEEWNFQTNAKGLSEFWQTGMERMKDWEHVVTVGMRGDGDEPMSEDANISLLENIVKEQRNIISKVTGKKASETPQVWALYKEVQDYFDNGMKVPDDITLLLCDDNWGNIRKLPDANAKPRKGGYGMYYHFDYVGGPRSYKWLNVSQVPRIWEQMNLTYRYGVHELWIVNVGDLKPMEYPIQFFLDMAWNPEAYNENNLFDHTIQFCTTQFGETYAREIARLIDQYTKYNSRVTPELLNEKTYSLNHYNEFERVTDEYKDLLNDAYKVYHLLPSEYHDAYHQLVLYPIAAMANLYEMYYAVAMNHQLAANNNPQANDWATKATQCFKRDSLLCDHYNHKMSNGKWQNMMNEKYIGYTSWNGPKTKIMPTLKRVAPQPETRPTYIFEESNGYVSIEAEHFNRSSNGKNTSWIIIPNFGKTLSGVKTTPVTINPDKETWLEYEMEINTTDKITIEILTAPTLNFNANKGLRYAISLNGGKEEIVNINGTYKGELGPWQANRIIKNVTAHKIKPGKQTLRIRPLEPGIVLQKILINTGGLKPSYLGAPESNYKK